MRTSGMTEEERRRIERQGMREIEQMGKRTGEKGHDGWESPKIQMSSTILASQGQKNRKADDGSVGTIHKLIRLRVAKGSNHSPRRTRLQDDATR